MGKVLLKTKDTFFNKQTILDYFEMFNNAKFENICRKYLKYSNGRLKF